MKVLVNKHLFGYFNEILSSKKNILSGFKQKIPMYIHFGVTKDLEFDSIY